MQTDGSCEIHSAAKLVVLCRGFRRLQITVVRSGRPQKRAWHLCLPPEMRDTNFQKNNVQYMRGNKVFETFLRT